MTVHEKTTYPMLVWSTLLLLIVLVFATGNLDASDKTQESAMRLKSGYSYSDSMDRIKGALQSSGFRIFATIDHQAAARDVGLDMPPTTVLIYGNPKGGTPLMLAAPDFALELPLRVLVRQDNDGETFVTLNSSSDLEGKHGLPTGMAAKLAPAEMIIAGAIAAPNMRTQAR
ncbi:DUF302 domain-containing protein [Starkeya sp. ORNL1]|uniref:DUF302 domain-containing protein n=1 Tax=Starkeya sp. ORNL1 TaxID=2709380 RepID=UPI0019816D49|nr:DUF302 domain-containing protein [Starkeya sp. ORNL1]